MNEFLKGFFTVLAAGVGFLIIWGIIKMITIRVVAWKIKRLKSRLDAGMQEALKRVRPRALGSDLERLIDAHNKLGINQNMILEYLGIEFVETPAKRELVKQKKDGGNKQ